MKLSAESVAAFLREVEKQTCSGHYAEALHNAVEDLVRPAGMCMDFDAECPYVLDKLGCHLHDVAQGWCPFLPGGN